MRDVPIDAESQDDLKQLKRSRRTLDRSINSNRHILDLVRLCKSLPECERVLSPSGIGYFDRGYVYLMEKLMRIREDYCIRYISSPSCPYKIGATKRPFKFRRTKLWNSKRLISRAKYCTPVPFALEKALHSYFDEFRVRRQGERRKGDRKNLQGELFRLPPEHVEGFKSTVANIEQWVLIGEEARLELEIMQMESALRYSNLAEQNDERER